MDNLILLSPLISKLGLMLMASLMVERFLFIIGWLINRSTLISVTTFEEGHSEEKKKLTEIERALEESALLSDEEGAAGDPREIEPHPSLRNFLDSGLVEVEEIIPIENARNNEERFSIWRNDQNTRKDFWMQILGTFIAVAACYYTKFSIWIFFTWANQLQTNKEIELSDVEGNFWGYLFTGIIIGAGSKPVNLLMNFLLRRKIIDTKQKVEEVKTGKAQPLPLLESRPVSNVITAAALKDVEATVGFNYDGGYRPDRLEYTHLYQRDPDLIVYHHTAMHLDATFEDVAREFDRKGWLTGYHCVVFKDGSIRVLCRWDRFGNHARGYNARSLGIALNGNFETDPKVPGSNWDGRFGPHYPTTAQLDAAARLVALWSMLYEIEAVFPAASPRPTKGIVPHKHIAAKACPGNKFPYDRFEIKVTEYLNEWQADEKFKKSLADFRRRPMIIPELVEQV